MFIILIPPRVTQGAGPLQARVPEVSASSRCPLPVRHQAVCRWTNCIPRLFSGRTIGNVDNNWQFCRFSWPRGLSPSLGSQVLVLASLDCHALEGGP
jgi:hypothetical protein